MPRRARGPGPSFLPGLLVCLTAGCSSVEAPSGESTPADREAVQDAVEALFNGMRQKNLDVIRAVLDPEATIVAVDAGSGASSRTTVEDFLSVVAEAPYQLNEWIWDPRIHIDGPLASLWAPYGFHRDARFSHWGFDAFLLVRQDAAWRIVAIAYTRRTEPLRPPRQMPGTDGSAPDR